MCRILKITGQSLEPDYHAGDFVISSRLAVRFGGFHQGDVVVVRLPGYGTLIKRIDHLDGNHLWVGGSHPDSIDSRDFGLIGAKQVAGKVVLQIRKREKDGHTGI
jgi:hypothetical protein